ncbi:Restriction endonuclease [Candidatus Electrothrix laxa]
MIKEAVPVYYFSKITDIELRSLVHIKQNFSNDVFDSWFSDQSPLKKDDIAFLTELLEKEFNFIRIYKEEDLKVKFIAPILNRIDFRDMSREIRDFYEEKITYQADKFIFTGTTDFLISKGLEYSEKPYFFIQEFKKGKESSYPEAQLLAEIIAGIELNKCTIMKGAYIVGAIWTFVIVKKLAEHTYQFFISVNFDSTKIEDLKGIYKNLLFVKNEIFSMVEAE